MRQKALQHHCQNSNQKSPQCEVRVLFLVWLQCLPLKLHWVLPPRLQLPIYDPYHLQWATNEGSSSEREVKTSRDDAYFDQENMPFIAVPAKLNKIQKCVTFNFIRCKFCGLPNLESGVLTTLCLVLSKISHLVRNKIGIPFFFVVSDAVIAKQ